MAVIVYIVLRNGGRAMAKVSKFRVWNAVPEESTFFGDTIISLKYSPE